MALYFLESAAGINGDISEIRHSSVRIKLQVYTDSKIKESWLTIRAAFQIKQLFVVFFF